MKTRDDELISIQKLPARLLPHRLTRKSLANWIEKGRVRKSDGKRIYLHAELVCGVRCSSVALVQRYVAEISAHRLDAMIIGGTLDGQCITIDGFVDRDYEYLELANSLENPPMPTDDNVEYESYRLRVSKNASGAKACYLVENRVSAKVFIERALANKSRLHSVA